MASKERELLEKISNGTMSWGPADNTEAALERFDQIEAKELTQTLDSLIAGDFIGDYTTHEESFSGNRRIDGVLITKGLTFKGQDKEQWPL